ncbi:TIGR03773 family transporter-associated surface protein [Kribbella sp.]|uniref:TIGR03773 family transporter-associated surface protein n=1 Tax=Kribbella sp. TaxID=1871183 RepID=UPI002D618964|nr:TIGR03773 family transporter-associated surface protein [Kribbella sp.]HZX03510.1 TIGR03773 family transporter-associated surface protein [Kribbella sp.]
MKRTAALLLATVFLAAASPPVAMADSVPSATERRVIANGHVDLGPRFVNGAWTIQLRDDTAAPAVWRPLENVVLQASGKAQLAVPDDPAYTFLGKPGAQVWVIPQVQQAGVVWPGWNTQDPEVAQRIDREVTWTLEDVRGPGKFTLFLNSDFGRPAPVFDSSKPFPQETGIDGNTHVHGNWTFDAQGTYLLAIAMTAKLTDGTTVADRRTLRLYVGDGDATSAFAASTPSPTASPTPAPTAYGPTADAGENQVAIGWIGAGAGVLALFVVGVVVTRRRRA